MFIHKEYFLAWSLGFIISRVQFVSVHVVQAKLWGRYPPVRLGYVTEVNWPKRPGETPYRNKAKYFLDVFDRILTVPFADLTFIKMWFTKIINFLAESLFRQLLLKKDFLKKEKEKSDNLIWISGKHNEKEMYAKSSGKHQKIVWEGNRLGLEIIRRFEEPGFHWRRYVWNKLTGIKRKGANKERNSK